MQNVTFVISQIDVPSHFFRDAIEAYLTYFKGADNVAMIGVGLDAATTHFAERAKDKNIFADPPRFSVAREHSNAPGLGVLIDLDMAFFQEASSLPVWARMFERYVQVEKPYEAYENQDVITQYHPNNQHVRADCHKIYEDLSIKMIRDMELRSVMDARCGSGVFYDRIKMAGLGVDYVGYDYSRSQIIAAIKANKFYNFDVADMSRFDADKFSRVDAFHSWSVFPFMSRKQQIRTLENILASDTMAYFQITITHRGLNYMPKGVYQNRAIAFQL